MTERSTRRPTGEAAQLSPLWAVPFAEGETMESPRRQCYWLREAEPESTHPDRYRVCVVTENEPDYQPTGGGEVVPWYWDQATCDVRNEEYFGVSPEEVRKIVLSSLFCNA